MKRYPSCADYGAASGIFVWAIDKLVAANYNNTQLGKANHPDAAAHC